MLGNVAGAAITKALLHPGEKANTAGATSSWIDVRDAEGDLMIIAQVGTLTAGSITWTVESALDDQGDGGAAFTPVQGAFVAGESNQIQKRSIPARSVGPFIRIIGTIVTGPADASASVSYVPKYAA